LACTATYVQPVLFQQVPIQYQVCDLTDIVINESPFLAATPGAIQFYRRAGGKGTGLGSRK